MLLVTNPVKSPITYPTPSLPSIPIPRVNIVHFRFNWFSFSLSTYHGMSMSNAVFIFSTEKEKRENNVEEVRGANSECQDIQLMSDTIT
jgi:hypothetical protein